MTQLAQEDPADTGAALSSTAWQAGRDSAVVVLTFLLMFTGVGHLSAQAGLSAPQTAIMTLFTVAAPAQVAAVEVLSGGAWASAILAAAIVNLRFMVMIAAVAARLPPSGCKPGDRLRQSATLGLLSASSFAVVLTRLGEGRIARPALYTGLVGAFCAASAVVGAVAGHALGSILPPELGRALTLLVPLYFATLILRQRADRPVLAAAILGGVAIPVLGLVLGNLSILIGGVAVGIGLALWEIRRNRKEAA
ncbi:AzlC family ABC transporter permease [Telmatospirillum sp. J64-1]|uniref:AzlC family ABC transporter permease n=1 Tax=Telmatospirillum sp. J64-1 TaxID=2502183 RepID=UPI0021023E82|nr:AzlC family ABC transporter permease [Telmatospirillum sp. J64-1]